MKHIKLNQKKMFPSTNNDFETKFNAHDSFDNSFFEEDAILPAMNVIEHDDGFDIEFAVPGFSKKDFNVSIKDNVLNVSGEQKEEFEEFEDDYTHKEYNYNFFKRAIKLPTVVSTNKEVKTTYSNGILKLNLLKK